MLEKMIEGEVGHRNFTCSMSNGLKHELGLIPDDGTWNA